MSKPKPRRKLMRANTCADRSGITMTAHETKDTGLRQLKSTAIFPAHTVTFTGKRPRKCKTNASRAQESSAYCVTPEWHVDCVSAGFQTEPHKGDRTWPVPRPRQSPGGKMRRRFLPLTTRKSAKYLQTSKKSRTATAKASSNS